MKKKITISLREDIWKEFQKYCKENDLVPSYEIQKFMNKELVISKSMSRLTKKVLRKTLK